MYILEENAYKLGVGGECVPRSEYRGVHSTPEVCLWRGDPSSQLSALSFQTPNLPSPCGDNLKWSESGGGEGGVSLPR